jgi:hypothetical protein
MLNIFIFAGIVLAIVAYLIGYFSRKYVAEKKIQNA